MHYCRAQDAFVAGWSHFGEILASSIDIFMSRQATAAA
jgi:hypothetical protein